MNFMSIEIFCYWLLLPSSMVLLATSLAVLTYNQLNPLPVPAAPAARVIIRPPALPEDERQAAYLEAPGHRLFLAVLADLEDGIAEVSEQMDDIRRTPEELRHLSGSMKALRLFRDDLLTREADAKLTEEQRAQREQDKATSAS